MKNLGALIGRILLGLIFVLSGMLKLLHLSGTAAMIGETGFPLSFPSAVIAGIIEFGGGILLMIGFEARMVAFILFLYLIPVTLLFHVIPGGQVNQVNTMKNLAIMGGLLIVAAMGPGGLSVDNARTRAMTA